ncbi:MAG: 2Fe-2S iron-sulfur cluster-binding protein [Oculatellaceae cyanobacterium bins.114]|nr:2Fe-2S iron-sulfur cluster-binding protein [Oculatellaceae cyanobacterium bins.114]
MSYRLPPVLGEWIDRTQLISFTFEGTRYTGYAGDTITSALWAAGQRILGRSFKYHRPRGILSAANHDVNTLMQAGQRLNLRADVTQLQVDPPSPPLKRGELTGSPPFQGGFRGISAGQEMNLTAVNTVGGVMGDRASIINVFSRFLPVGFYYKAFHSKRFFPLWERLIRSMTGLGKADITTPHIRTAKRYDFCDVLVIGAGISGMTAALTAAEAGADVVIVDENAQAGGSGSYQRGGKTTRLDVTNLLEAIATHPNIRLYTNTQAAGYYTDHWIPLVHRDYLSKMRAKAVIVASGAYEQPAIFRNNDLPGVMLASAAQRLIYRYAVKPMHRAVVFTANLDGYRAALDLLAQGIEVKAIVDLHPDSSIPLNKGDWGDLLNQIRSHSIPIYNSYGVYEARPNPAGDGVSSAVICPIDADGQPQTKAQQAIACDGIVMSVGWAPAANLLYQAGTKMQFDPQIQQFVPEVLPMGVFACGRVNGVYAIEQKRLDGQRAGLAAAEHVGLVQDAETNYPPQRGDESSISPSHPWAIVPHPHGKEFVDFDEDLQLKDFYNAAQEGFDNIELLKRYTTVGMGPSQGKHSNMNALRILARITGKTPDQVGTTTARPFFHPVPMSHLAGRGFTPERRTPLHSRHAALGAQFMLAGVWRRPEYYHQTGQSREECIRAEVNAVRTGVGIIDVGTLGKLEVRGAGAIELLERVYTGRYANLKVGMSRYALMLDELGVVMDDGVIARLGTDRFYFTTTTSGAATIYRELTRLNTLWQLDCGIVNLTGARAAVNLAGPCSREVLSQLTDLDLSGAAFPYLGVRQTVISGIPVLLMRVGFVGEWGYEIHVAAESAPALWDALMEAGAPVGIRPFGVEAQRLLRLEKGHLIVGQDTDGLTTPFMAGLEWAVKRDKPFFIGQRSLQIVQSRPLKQKLVGFMLQPGFSGTAPQECHLAIAQGEIVGRVTSIAFSPTLDRYIGLAYLQPELAKVGNPFTIRLSDGSLVTAIVSPTPFYDPENLRQKEFTPQRQEVTV